MEASATPANWLEINRANWDARVPVHLTGEVYDIPAFVAGEQTLRDHEPGEVGDVRGKSLLHLQCHIGLDTLSWARRGATVTGLDFSRPALDAAASVAAQIGAASARFVRANVYDGADVLAGQSFDIVYTSIGSLQFLPDLEGWARVVAALLAPGGICYVAETHPLLGFLDFDCRSLRGGYFNRQVIVKDEGTYGNPGAELESPVSYQWIHHIAEVVSVLGGAGLRVEFVHEHDWIWFPIFPVLVRQDDGRWRFPDGHPTLPLQYSLRARKDSAT
ncbi:class I SAM-dependent methyltransferase [Phytohabitans flavus]|uniref:Type 12 methyltransferase n=1 Tax=Phytohabitans flavus TaxID=1076124 RepID=A0A6F8XP10_9ACTN|nr:class I SAM-dependent methyltransferase [Phytohabitans flavus]BCB75537.1 type 12 methyltransferase [Phytohabitans flavus]